MSNIKKLNAKEILAIIEENYSVESFAYGSWGELKDPDKVDTSAAELEAKTLIAAKSEYWKKVSPNFQSLPSPERERHPDYIAYIKMPTGYGLVSEDILNKLGLGAVEEVEQQGGEDEGSNWYSVKYFKDHDVYIKTCGYYTSYEGTDFYDGYGFEVKPVQVEVTQYHAVK